MLSKRAILLQGALVGILYVVLIFFVTITQACHSSTSFLSVRASEWDLKELHGKSKLCALSLPANTVHFFE